MECLHLRLQFNRVEHQGGFVNSTFPLQANVSQKSNSTYDKKIKANLYENSRFQLNRTEKTTEKRCLTSSNRATIVNTYEKQHKLQKQPFP